MNDGKRGEGRLRVLARRLAAVTGLEGSLRRLLRTYRRARRERRFSRFCTGLDTERASADITAVILTIDPGRFFERCLASVKNQKLPPGCINIVKNVMPFPRASEEALAQVKTPFYVSVDDDMLLAPACFQRLYQLITEEENRAEAVLCLDDPILGPIEGIHLYRTAAVGELGLPRYEGKGWERRLSRKLREAGKTTIRSEAVVGKHHPDYLPHEAFWKFRFIGEKVRYYGDPLWEPLGRLCEYWLRTRSLVALYALAGLFDGLQAEVVSEPLSYESRSQHPSFLRIDRILKESREFREQEGARP